MAQLANLLMDAGQPVVIKYNTLVQATTGYTSISVAGAANVTLTNNQASHAIVELTGVLTGNIQVIVPAKEKPYIFLNNTTGAFSITVKTAAGSGPAISQAAHTSVYCNGTNVIQVSASVATSGAPSDAQYLVAATHVTLTAERAATDTATISWDFGTASQAKANIVNASVTYTKLQDASATARILARVTAGAGSYEEATFTELLDLVGSAAQGDILIRSSANWIRLGAGTDGEFLKTRGPGVNPIWDAPTGTGSAPIGAQYIVSASDASLTAERVATDTGTINWSFGTAGQAQASIVNGSITYGKLQDAAVTARILARISAGAGSYEEATLTQVLDLMGGTAQGDVIIRGVSNWTRLAAGTDGEFLKTQGPGANPQWATPVTGGGGAPVDAAYIVSALNGGLSAERKATDTATIDWNFGTTGEALASVVNGSITYAKLQDASATSRILARRTAGAGSYEENSLTQILDMVGSAAQGDIFFRGAVNWTRLGAGTDGEFLKTQGTGANPMWAAASGAAGAPTDAQYIVSTLSSGLSAERVLTDTATINWSAGTPGQMTAGITNASVTYTKLQDASATARILARVTAGAGSYEEASLTQVLDLVGSAAHGDILIRSSSNWVRLAAGTDGEFFQTRGAGVNPRWFDPVPAGSVTYAKMQNASTTSRILARRTAGAGSYEEATLTQILDFSVGTAQGDIIYRGASTWNNLAAGTDGEFLKTQGAGANPIWAAASGAAGAPTDAQYIVAALSSGLSAERVATDTGTISWSFGTAGQALASIVNGSITYGKLQDASATSRILARRTAGAGSYEENSLTQVLDMVGSAAQGDVLFRGAVNWTRLGAGTDGEFLKTQGTGANPVWAAASGAAGAPTDAQYIVSALSSGLSAERVLTDTAAINWGTGTPGQVTAGLVDGGVSYAKLQNASVTARILARITAGAGSYEEATLTQVLDLVGSAAQGDILIRSSASWIRLGAGTDGEFFQTRGAGVNPRWFDAVPAGSVTYAKLQDASATSRILARKTAGAGSYEEGTLSQILDFVGSAAQGDVFYRGPSLWARLAAGANGEFLQSQGSGANPQWATPAGTGAPVGAQYLVSTANGTLTAERVATDTATIAWDFGTAAQGKADVVNDSITYTKLQNASATARILARITAGTGDYEEATISQAIDLIGGTAQGDILFRGAANWTRLAAGTNGEFLKTQGPGANPQWTGAVAGAPTDAQYIVATANSTLTAERVLTDATIITWNTGTAGQVSAAISNNSITYGKMQTVTSPILLGRGTSGTGDIGEITLNSTLTLSTGNILGRAAITGPVEIGAGSNLATIAGEALNYGMLPNQAASTLLGRTSSGIGSPQAITLGAGLTMTGVVLSSDTGAPTGAQYIVSASNATLTAERVLTDTATISWGTGTPGEMTAGIVNGSVSYTKFQNASVTSRILARITAGSGSYEEATITQVLDLVGSAAQGDILFRGAATWTRLGAGTSGEFLKTLGTGANPLWAAPSTGAPVGAQYIVSASDATLTAERVLTDSAAINWNTGTAGQVSAGIINASVTYAKMQDATNTARFLARTSPGAGSYEEATLSTVLDFSGAAQGAFLFRGPSFWNVLAAGTNGEFLQSQGAGANPQWAAPLSGLGTNKLLYATSATTAGTDAHLHWDSTNNWLSIGVSAPTEALHVRGGDGIQPAGLLESFITATGGPAWIAQHARGTAASPTVLVAGDAAGGFSALGWARNAGDSANAWVGVGRMRGIVDTVDAQNRIGGRLIFEVSAGVSAGLTEAMRLTQASNLLVGATTCCSSAVGILVLGNNTAPITSPANIAQAWCSDRDGVAGKAGWNFMGETGATHTLSDGVTLNKLSNGQRMDFPEPLTQLLTIAAAATSTSSIDIPANAVVFGVSARVTVAIPTATTFSVGVSGTATRYGTGISVAANTTNPGTNDATRFYSAATAIVITPSATPATNVGRVRLSIFYYILVPPTA